MALPNGDLITTVFDPQMAYPVDKRMQVDTLNSRDSISMFIRWEGMTVYVLEDSKIYILQGGRSNEYWKELGTGSGTGGTTFVGQFATADLLPTSGRSAGDYAFVGTGDDFVQYNWDNIANQWVMAEGQTDMASEFFHIGYKTPLRRPVIFPLFPKDVLVETSGDFVFAPETSVARFIFTGEVEAIRGIETAAADREIKLVNRTGSDIPLRDKASGIPSDSGFDFGGSDYTWVNGSEITLKGNGTYWELAPNNQIAFSDHLDSVNAQVSVGGDGLRVITGVYDINTGESVQFKEFTSETPSIIDGSFFVEVGGDIYIRAIRVINPKLFGAVGDGVIDDTIAIKTLFNCAKYVNTIEGISDEVYRVTDFATALNFGNLKISGLDLLFDFSTLKSQGVRLEGFKSLIIEDCKWNSTNPLMNAYCLNIKNGEFLNIRTSEFKSARDACVQFEEVKHVANFTTCRFEDVSNFHGIGTPRTGGQQFVTENITIDNCYFKDIQYYAADCHSIDLKIINCEFVNASSIGKNQSTRANKLPEDVDRETTMTIEGCNFYYDYQTAKYQIKSDATTDIFRPGTDRFTATDNKALIVQPPKNGIGQLRNFIVNSKIVYINKNSIVNIAGSTISIADDIIKLERDTDYVSITDNTFDFHGFGEFPFSSDKTHKVIEFKGNKIFLGPNPSARPTSYMIFPNTTIDNLVVSGNTVYRNPSNTQTVRVLSFLPTVSNVTHLQVSDNSFVNTIAERVDGVVNYRSVNNFGVDNFPLIKATTAEVLSGTESEKFVVPETLEARLAVPRKAILNNSNFDLNTLTQGFFYYTSGAAKFVNSPDDLRNWFVEDVKGESHEFHIQTAWARDGSGDIYVRIYVPSAWYAWKKIGGATTFPALTDTPANYTGHKNKSVKVNNEETALVFVSDGVDVRNITDGGSIAPTLTDGFIGSRLNFTSSTAVTLQGFTSAGGQSSVTLVNPHSTNNLTLVHNGAGTVKYIDGGATDLVIAPKTAVKLEIVGNEIYRVL